MSKEEIRSHTEALLQELKDKEEVDGATREKLEKLAGEIHQKLGDEDPELSWSEDFQGKLEQVAVEFQEEHPTLSELMRRVSQALANLGI